MLHVLSYAQPRSFLDIIITSQPAYELACMS